MRRSASRPRRTQVVTRAGFAGYRELAGRTDRLIRPPPLRLSDGTAEWLSAGRVARRRLVAPRHELFRVISGRRSLDRIHELGGEGDPSPYLPVLSPYPLPS